MGMEGGDADARKEGRGRVAASDEEEEDECSDVTFVGVIFLQRVYVICSPLIRVGPSGHHFPTSFLLAPSPLLTLPLGSCDSSAAGSDRSGTELV